MKLKLNIALLLLALSVSACRKNPIERLTDPNSDGVVPQSSGIFVVYDDELKTGGGLALLNGAENQSVDLANQDGSRIGRSQIKYTWNGQPIAGQHANAGFQLVITPDGSTLGTTPAKNLSGPGYTRISMRIRGSLSAENTLVLEGPTIPGVPGTRPATQPTLTAEWQNISFSIPSADFQSVKIFVTIIIVYSQPPRTTAPGNGGTIYIDNVQYER